MPGIRTGVLCMSALVVASCVDSPLNQRIEPQAQERPVVWPPSSPTVRQGIVTPTPAPLPMLGPEMSLSIEHIEFGCTMLGSSQARSFILRSTGQKSLEIYGFRWADAPAGGVVSTDFELSDDSGYSAQWPSEELPLRLEPGDMAQVTVVHTPSTAMAVDSLGHPVIDTATLIIRTNAPQSEATVLVTGVGTTAACPIAVATVEPDGEVAPQTLLQLTGDNSFASSGSVVAWEWEVEQPIGSHSVFVPGPEFPNPTFEANVVGEYIFRLRVWDEHGTQSVLSAQTQVSVVPAKGIRVELLWHTPGDPDESDTGPEAGTDLDLHFVRDEYATGGPDRDGDGEPDPWFDQPFDCFWHNPHPNWGWYNSSDDDPGLDRDDTDGAGPENLNLLVPEDATYRVGVHYYCDHQYGESLATIRIFIDGALVYEKSDVLLKEWDMWDVAIIDWTTRTVIPTGGLDTDEVTILSKYPSPLY